ncbi:histone-lysine N-methyltransferase SETMAR [Trichonephila clavipes]|nr:histone-lysine N-methyltransferase SETMAR [Trichonephila clavipes]
MRAVIRFLWTKNVSASDIHSQIVEVYGEEEMRRQHVAKLCHSFQSSRQDVENHNMVGSSRLRSSTTEINTARIEREREREEMIQNDRRVTLREISSELQSSRQDVENHNMAGSSRPRSSTTETNTARIEEIIQNDRRVSLREISSEQGSVQHTVSDVLRYSKTVL